VVLSLALHEVEHSRAQEAWLRTSVVPAAEALVVAREEALRRGPGTVFDLLRARSARLRARASRVAAEGRRRAAELDAWLLLAALPRGEEGR
jgi:outer membrane protein TolC